MRLLVNAVKRDKSMTDMSKLQMRDIIRNAVQRVYVVGAKYAAEWFQREFIMTQTDIENIKALSSEFGDRMQWRIDNYVLNRPEDKNDVTTDFITSTFAGYVAPRTLSVAIKEKSRQIMTATNFSTETNLQTFTSAVSSANAAEAEPHVVLKWITANDDKICPVCLTLEGSYWEVNDPDVPTPDSDTHPNCRCMLRLVELDFE